MREFKDSVTGKDSDEPREATRAAAGRLEPTTATPAREQKS